MVTKTPRPKYQKVIPAAKVNDIAKEAKPVTRKPLTPGRDTRPATEVKVRK